MSELIWTNILHYLGWPQTPIFVAGLLSTDTKWYFGGCTNDNKVNGKSQPEASRRTLNTALFCRTRT